MEVKLRTLTPLWTGDADRKGETLRETGIIGSLRWWYEALVRGLGGYACDPTDEKSRCTLDQKKFRKKIEEGQSIQDTLDELGICPVCQLFGCTGWGRKFKIKIRVSEENIVKGKGPNAGIKKNTLISINIALFSEPSSMCKWLFAKTLWIIENYGAIGGRTTWKPNGSWGTSYGIIKIEDYDKIGEWNSASDVNSVRNWIKKNKEIIGRDNNKDWFNFEFYWIIEGKCLDRNSINKLVKRNQNNPQNYLEEAKDFDKWIGGKKGVSKKIFSFSYPEKVFGYVRSEEDLREMEKRVRDVLGEEIAFKTGRKILEELE